MIFYIYLALIVVVPLLFLRFSSKYDRWTNFFGSFFTVLLIGGLLFLLICSGGGSSPNVTTSEKTYTLDQKSVPVYEDADNVLRFQYIEDGKTDTFNHEIVGTTVSLEPVKEIKITTKDSVYPLIAPWNLGWGYTAEFIK